VALEFPCKIALEMTYEPGSIDAAFDANEGSLVMTSPAEYTRTGCKC
jgi:hypothetical protein